MNRGPIAVLHLVACSTSLWSDGEPWVLPTWAELGLNARASNALLTEGIDTVDKLLVMTRDDLLCIGNCGKTCARHIEERLATFFLRLPTSQRMA